jgi:hypothetical protein
LPVRVRLPEASLSPLALARTLWVPVPLAAHLTRKEPFLRVRVLIRLPSTLTVTLRELPRGTTWPLIGTFSPELASLRATFTFNLARARMRSGEVVVPAELTAR